MNVREIAALVDADVEGDAAIAIRRVAKIEEAGEGDVTFVANPKYAKFLPLTNASAVIVARSLQLTPDERSAIRAVLLRTNDPYLAFLKALRTFNPPSDPLPPGIHATAVIAPDARLGKDIRAGEHVVVGSRAIIGDGVMLCAGTVIGADVAIGNGALLHPNVTVREGCRIGQRVIIHAGSVIGSDGFGFAPKADGSYEKIPQMGIVVVEDEVEIGANCTIDRATLGETVIRRGAKLDNLIQVAHNVVIGENTVIAAQAGISGSTKIGAGCMIGGQVGFTGHIDIADRTKVGAQSGVHRSVQTPGTTIFGYPAMPHREAMKTHGAISRLPDLVATVQELTKKVRELEEQLGKTHSP